MRVWDTFMYAGEADMLECRLRALDDSPVYRHVIAESVTDHRGNPKPLRFREHATRFAPWLGRIVYVPVGELTGPSAFAREQQHREQLAGGLTGAAGGDVILAADVDEIPSAAGIAAAAAAAGPGVVLEMVGCFFAVDWLWPVPVRTSVAVPVGAFTGFARARARGDTRAVAVGAGHHLTWLGGPEAVRAKMRSHCHTEVHGGLDPVRAYTHGGVPFPAWHTSPLIPADVDASWPGYVSQRRCPPVWFRPRNGDT